jgi:hypothetical protein
MSEVATSSSTVKELLCQWLGELQDQDRAAGTIRRYKRAIESFLAWDEREKHRPLTLALLTPITLVG